ncbi:MAG: hypothetical protein AAGE80_09440 [Pseudomonadota bacterium]
MRTFKTHVYAMMGAVAVLIAYQSLDQRPVQPQNKMVAVEAPVTNLASVEIVSE